MNYLENDIDRLNIYFRYKIVNIITVESITGPLDPKGVVLFSSGLFLEASEIGLWLMNVNKDNRGKKTFFFYDKIVKIEEVGNVSPRDLTEEENEIINKFTKNYENKRESEIEEENNDENLPDVVDPSNQNKIIKMIKEVQEGVLSSKKEGKNFLEERTNNLS